MKSRGKCIINTIALLAVLISSIAIPASAHAFGATITVTTVLDNTTTDGYCSLREAITNANSNAGTYPDCSSGIGADAIVFSDLLVVYTITLASTLPGISDTAGLIIYGDDTFTVSGNNLYRVFIVNGNASLTLDGLTVANGRSVSGVGAGVFNGAGTLTIINCLFSGNSAIGSYGGGIYNIGTLILTDSIISNNSATYVSGSGGRGGGMYNATGSTASITRTIFSGNSADIRGGGIYSLSGTMTLTDSTLTNNTMISPGDGGGGIYNYQSNITITHSTLSNNHANSSGSNGGGIFNDQGTLTVALSTFSGNSVTTGVGGGIASNGTATISNSTFSSNYASFGAGIYNGTGGTLTVTNGTFSGNSTLSSPVFGGGIYNADALNLYNTILANTVNGGDCYQAGTITSNNNLIESTGSNACGLTNGVNGNIIGSDPNLDAATLINPIYYPLNNSSPAINAGNDAKCAASPLNNTSQNGVTRPQGTHCDIGSYESMSNANVVIKIGGTTMGPGSYTVLHGDKLLETYAGFNGGPVFIDSTANVPVVSSLRLLYNNKTFSELMGVPTGSLSNDYWLPYYANIPGTDTQIRFTNTNATLSTTVNVYLGDNPTPVYTKVLAASSADRFNLPSGTTGGPVHIVGTGGVNILAGMRVVYGGSSSFDELMAYPTAQLATEYWFPFYNHNNVNIDTEIRVANTSSTTSAPVDIYIGDTLMDTTTIAPLSVYLKSFPGVNGGPVRVVSTSGTPIPVVASLRLLYNKKTFSELMGVPTSQLSNDYWLPYYANIPGTDTQIRFTNTHATLSTTVNVYLGSNPTPVYTKTLLPKTADRFNLPSGTTGGPVHIVGTGGVNILAGMRVVYGGNSSFDELMAYPTALLSSEYWFPFYNHNNVNLDTEVRIGVP